MSALLSLGIEVANFWWQNEEAVTVEGSWGDTSIRNVPATIDILNFEKLKGVSW